MHEERVEWFWSRVDRAGPVPAHAPELGHCWLWTRQRSHGYGVTSFGRKSGQLRVHRVAWEMTNGAIPDGKIICHHCDNPPCCNPSHLYVGGKRENALDAVKRGQWRGPTGRHINVGSAHGRSKLTEADIPRIRERRAAGESARSIAADLGVHFNTVYRVVRRSHWRHVP